MTFRESQLDDLDVFLNTDEFADTAVLHAASGDVNLNVLFDYEFLESEAFGVSVDSRDPVVICKTSLVEGVVANGDGIDVTSQDIASGTKAFVVRDHQPDGKGMSALILSDA